MTHRSSANDPVESKPCQKPLDTFPGKLLGFALLALLGPLTISGSYQWLDHYASLIAGPSLAGRFAILLLVLAAAFGVVTAGLGFLFVGSRFKVRYAVGAMLAWYAVEIAVMFWILANA